MARTERAARPHRARARAARRRRAAPPARHGLASRIAIERILWASLGLTPIALALHYGLHAGDVAVFSVSAAALIPLAWLIGESTEHLSERTGPGIGGFVNATFGNAPELIIALIAVQQGLPGVVRGSITGSVVSNLLLVLGLTLVLGTGDDLIDRRSLLPQLGMIVLAGVAFLIPSIPGFHGDANRHSLWIASAPVAGVLLLVYVVVNVRGLRRAGAMHRAAPHAGTWSTRTSLLALSAAATATAFVSESLVGSLQGFGRSLGLSTFFVSVVIVAIVGNASEHGGAIVVARRGKRELASEIAISSSAQVAVFVAPAAALVSVFGKHDLTLAFRPVELATVALATLLVGWIVVDGRSTAREGYVLLAAYAGAVVAYGFS